MVVNNPYKFTSDDVFFQVFADRYALVESEYAEARTQFFSKGQPCFRASPLTKSYGFGVHADSQGKVALVGMETPLYKSLQNDASVKKVRAMRKSKK